MLNDSFNNDWKYGDTPDLVFPELDSGSWQFAFITSYEFGSKRYSDYLKKKKSKIKKG